MKYNEKTIPSDPTTGMMDTETSEGFLGLTKREKFAAMAMQSFINIQYGSFESCADAAVQSADFLIASLNK